MNFLALRRRKISIRISYVTFKERWEDTKKIEEINVFVSQLLLDIHSQMITPSSRTEKFLYLWTVLL